MPLLGRRRRYWAPANRAGTPSPVAARRLPLPATGRRMPGLAREQWAGLSFDDLVGAREQRGRHSQPEHLGALEIDHQFVSGRLHDRQLGWFRALQDAANVHAGLTPHLPASRTVADQASGDDLLALAEHRRNSILNGHLHQMLSLLAEKGVVVNEEGSDRFFATHRESG